MSNQRGKAWGYEVEALALKALQSLSPEFYRTGASSQKQKGHPDIVLEGGRLSEALLLVVTKEKGRGSPLMVTVPMEDFLLLVSSGLPAKDIPVLVSVKGRAKMWLASVWRELRDWARANAVRHATPGMTRGTYGKRMPS